jgi:hypothetical protein
MGTELLELEPVPPLLELELPLEELPPPCPSLEEDKASAELELVTEPELKTSEELLNASLEELLPVVPLELELPPEELLSPASSGGLGISSSEEQEKMNVMASTRNAVNVWTFFITLLLWLISCKLFCLNPVPPDLIKQNKVQTVVSF